MTDLPSKALIVVDPTHFLLTDYLRVLTDHNLSDVFIKHINPSYYLHLLFSEVYNSVDEDLCAYLENVLPEDLLASSDILNDIFIVTEIIVDLFERYIDQYYKHPTGEYYAFKSVRLLPDGSLALIHVDM